MRPTINDILSSVLWTFERKIMPSLEGDDARSAAFTVRNLISYCINSSKFERENLLTDRAELALLLRAISDLFKNAASSFGEAAKITSLCALALAPVQESDDDPLVVEVAAMTASLDAILSLLQREAGHLSGVEGYSKLRSEIRDYLTRQLDRQGAIISESFTGPRR